MPTWGLTQACSHVSPHPRPAHLDEDELGAQRGRVRKLLSKAQHHPAVGQPALAVVELLQLCGWGRGRGRRDGLVKPSHPPPEPDGVRALAPTPTPSSRSLL